MPTYSGEPKGYMDLDTREIYEYHAGDFFVTFPGTTYVQKAEAGTKMIFVKEPSINDKELIPMDEEAQKWMETEFDCEVMEYELPEDNKAYLDFSRRREICSPKALHIQTLLLRPQICFI